MNTQQKIAKLGALYKEACHCRDHISLVQDRLTLNLELANGERANPTAYLLGLLKTQSLEAWNGRQDEFRDWIAQSMADYFKRVEVQIYGHSN